MSEAVKLALKEGLRVFVMAVIPLSIVQLQSGAYDLRVLAIAGLIALLRFIDKLLHERADEDGWLKKQGLVGF